MRAFHHLFALVTALCLALLLPGPGRAQTVDPSFNVEPNGRIYAVAAVGDHIWVGGWFTEIGGVPRRNLARLHADGTVDTSLPDLALDGSVKVIRFDAAHNHLYVGGGFNEVGGNARRLLFRLDATTGALDTSFQPLQGVALHGTVYDVLVHGDKVVIGGSFLGDSSADALPNRLARLERSTGAHDPSFAPDMRLEVWSLLRQSDGRLVVGLTSPDTSHSDPYNPIRLEADGSRDPSFQSATTSGVHNLLPGPGDTFYALGWFGNSRVDRIQAMAQLNADGSRVSTATFTRPEFNGYIDALVRQADGQLLVSGGFTHVNGEPRTGLARLNADGTLDHSFGDVAWGEVTYSNRLLLLPDDRLLVVANTTITNGPSIEVSSRLIRLSLPPDPEAAQRTRPMIEYYHTEFHHFFMTSRPNEIALLDGLPHLWQRTGRSFLVYERPAEGRAGITRYYFHESSRKGRRGFHFYTLLDSDIELLDSLNPENLMVPEKPYKEGVDAYAIPPVVAGIGGHCASGLQPVYRVFRGEPRFVDDENHRFLTDYNRYRALVDEGWTDEGVNFCVPPNP